MSATSEQHRVRTSGRWAVYGATAAAVTAAAAAGAKAVDPDSRWYRALDKPPWQPPSWAFGVVWTPLYATVAWAGGRALLRSRGRRRRALAASLGVNLALNAGWNHLFFGRRSPGAGVAGTLLLDVSNAELIRRTARADRAAAAALLPYAAWCAFATALNGDIAYRNRSRPRLRRLR
ncbi:tryptophan-rich sensory protein [Actinomadura coerulea]|uniref:Tryptophan-rich sensory protein n=1 Tax=Actinomadura coerulea TaxID=46159 RepID=A0A7X0L1I8_9ACTN|nr:TspO/MBR family protein [Actinomadura coerulea]MBB6398239.1 tryptophan-rich sensory protein [Actinomadura coerulea]GGQ11114.1 sensory protein TspO [Actinomadura coerulea]